ncbi:hypothetical protein STAFG_5509 [Streptomyces afghaniensis 772]|uniref:Uncharacterized protein n=1 Tax=Streptomyces afghaniensis 772 TaxID=1283301 RepID=S4MPA2_9ACTN|nr:hypothetical protein STAFG_5509 [Streptomyces afghaniensis 772]
MGAASHAAKVPRGGTLVTQRRGPGAADQPVGEYGQARRIPLGGAASK